MERCKANEIVAERFKARSREINQNWVDAITTQTGYRTYQREHPRSTMEAPLLCGETQPDKDNYSGDKCSKRRRGKRPGWKKMLNEVVKEGQRPRFHPFTGHQEPSPADSPSSDGRQFCSPLTLTPPLAPFIFFYEHLSSGAVVRCSPGPEQAFL